MTVVVVAAVVVVVVVVTVLYARPMKAMPEVTAMSSEGKATTSC